MSHSEAPEVRHCPKRAPHRTRFAVATIALAAVALWLGFRHGAPAGASAPVLRTLTSYPGSELHPQISPEGERVVFCWNGPERSNLDVYVMPFKGGAATRLTSSPGRDAYATWSPDGKTIAFTRDPGPHGAIYLVPAAGGPEQKVTDAEAFSFVYTRDGKSLVFAERVAEGEPWFLTRFDLAAGTHHRLTDPPANTLGDADPAFSPDGKWLAFVRCGSGTESEVFVQDAAGGEAVPLTSDRHTLFGISWMPEGSEIVFSSDREDDRSLWKIALELPWSGGPPRVRGEPQRVAGAAANALHPFCARARDGSNVIAYQRLRDDFNLWLEETDGAARPIPIASSSRWDMTPSFSPDGKSIAFASERSGAMQIWVSDLNAAATRQLTYAADVYPRNPQWSPDGQWIAYDSRGHGGTGDLYVVPAGGGTPRRVTDQPSDDRRPTWSADGRFLYFVSDRDGSDQIWKVAAAGGEAAAVTLHGGLDAAESPDGRSLYVCRSDGLYARTAGGPEKRLLLFPCEGRWSVSTRGILYFDGAFHVLGFDGRPARDIEVPFKIALSGSAPLAISRDGRRFVWSNQDSRNSDAMVLEGVR